MPKLVVGFHEDRRVRTAQAAFREVRGEAAEHQRCEQIALLPAVEWKGRTLRTIRCQGITGKRATRPARARVAAVGAHRLPCVSVRLSCLSPVRRVGSCWRPAHFAAIRAVQPAGGSRLASTGAPGTCIAATVTAGSCSMRSRASVK